MLMNKPECMREKQSDNEKTWLSCKDPSMFAFTVKRLDMECKNNCEKYDTCKETKDKLARLLARNVSNMNRKEGNEPISEYRFNDS